MTDTPADRAIEIADAIFQNDCIAKRELIPAIERAIAEAVEGEREACAKIGDAHELDYRNMGNECKDDDVLLARKFYALADGAMTIAAAIRSRSQS